jgi:hypothetical protein
MSERDPMVVVGGVSVGNWDSEKRLAKWKGKG